MVGWPLYFQLGIFQDNVNDLISHEVYLWLDKSIFYIVTIQRHLFVVQSRPIRTVICVCSQLVDASSLNLIQCSKSFFFLFA